MDADELEQHIRNLGYTVESVTGNDSHTYTVVRDFSPTSGSLAAKTFDVAFLRITALPYQFPAALHTRPILVEMNSGPPLATQGSGIGAEWQYWSRRYDRPNTPRGIWAHILTVFGEV
jgi:hypothetical protein